MINPIADEKNDDTRVVRTSDWEDYRKGVRTSYRGHDYPTGRYYFIGFRILRNK
jgi:formylglycine-generating enzyme required for sulfatase activity